MLEISDLSYQTNCTLIQTKIHAQNKSKISNLYHLKITYIVYYLSRLRNYFVVCIKTNLMFIEPVFAACGSYYFEQFVSNHFTAFYSTSKTLLREDLEAAINYCSINNLNNIKRMIDGRQTFD